MRLWPRRHGTSARPARRRARKPGPRVRAQPPQRRLARRRRARAPARRLLARQVRRPARRGADRRAQGRAAEARDVHERVRPLRRAPRRRSSSSSRTRCSSSTTRATSTLGRLQARLGGGLAGHNGLRSIAQHLGTPGLPAAPRRRRPARARRPPAARRLRALGLRAARRRRARSSPRPPTRSRRSTPRGSKPPSAPINANARDNEHARVACARVQRKRAPARRARPVSARLTLPAGLPRSRDERPPLRGVAAAAERC